MKFCKQNFNTFVTEEGDIYFYDVIKLDDADLIQRENLLHTVEKIERKYLTDDIMEMMKLGITRKEMMMYIDAKHDLLTMYGIK